MPTTINVGLSKKIGLPEFGSVGASCNVQFEADHNLLTGNLSAFHQRVRGVFDACRQAVNDELARQQGVETPAHASNGQTQAGTPSLPGRPAAARPQNGSSNGNGHLISEKQAAYLRQLAKQVEGLGIRRLETLAQKLYGKPLAALTSFDASALIDTLKAIKAGQVDLAAVLEGAPK